MGLLSFNPDGEQSPGVVHGEGIHLGEYLHNENNTIKEVVTAVGGSWGGFATTWRAKNTDKVMEGYDGYLIVLQQHDGDETMSIRLEGTNS